MQRPCCGWWEGFLKTLETTAPRLHRVQSPCEIPKEWLRFRAGRIRKTIARGPIWPRGQLAPEPTPLSAISWTTIFTTQPPNLWSICTASTYYKRWLLIGESWKGSENLGYENPQQRTQLSTSKHPIYNHANNEQVFKRIYPGKQPISWACVSIVSKYSSIVPK